VARVVSIALMMRFIAYSCSAIKKGDRRKPL
jgi:hypothetical protein